MKLKLWLKLHKLNKAGTAPISLRITIAGKRAELTTDLRARPEQWDDSNQCLIVTTRADHTNNDTLDDWKADARRARAELRAAGRAVTAAAVAEWIRTDGEAPAPVAAVCLLEQAAGVLESHYASRDRSTYSNRSRALTLLRAWHKDKPLSPELFTPTRRQQFADYVLQQVASSSARAYLTCLQSLWSRAGVAGFTDSVFKGVRMPAHRAAVKLSLTKPQLHTLSTAILPAAAHHARNLYLACFYLHGSRVSAVLRLRWEDVSDTRVRYQAMKGGPLKLVLLSDPLRAILEQYRPAAPDPQALVLPLLPAEFFALPAAEQFKAQKRAITAANNGLKAAAKYCGLPTGLHLHTARHTMARLTYEATKDFRAAQHVLGHANAQQTQAYIRSMLTDEVDAAAAAVYDSL